LLEDFFDELFSFDEEKVIEIVDDLSVFGVVHDQCAVGEQGIKFFVKKSVNVERRAKCHKIPPCKH